MTEEQWQAVVTWLGSPWRFNDGRYLMTPKIFRERQGTSDWDVIGAIYFAFVRDGESPCLDVAYSSGLKHWFGVKGLIKEGYTPLEAALACATAYLESKAPYQHEHGDCA